MKTIIVKVPNNAINITVNYDTKDSEYLDLTDLIKSLDDGTYNTKYKVGDVFELDLGEYGVVHPVITAFHENCLYESSGNAKVTLITNDLLKCESKMNSKIVKDKDNHYKLGTGTIGGFYHSYLNHTLISIDENFIPYALKKRISTVYKTNDAYAIDCRKYTQIAPYRLWIPSADEIENLDPKDRIKTKNKNGATALYWLRDACCLSYFRNVDDRGHMYTSNTHDSLGIALGFCLN